MKYTFRPLVWTDPVTPDGQRRSRGAFKASWSSTIEMLEREIIQLGARDAIIEADFAERDLRLDGLPRANARQPTFPGVRIFIDSRHGPLVYATDSCSFWQHNVRSIALGLEALRAVDRYGITRRAEQYRGFRALEASNGQMSREQAQHLIDTYGSVRAAVRATHPDHGGDRAEFERVQEARRVLDI